MPAVTDRQLRRLAPWLEKGGANSRGERGLHCPLPNHAKGRGDIKRSASLNVRTGKWYCNGCAIGGSVAELIKLLPQQRVANVSQFVDDEGEPLDEIPPATNSQVKRYVQNLWETRSALRAFMDRRGLNEETLRRFEVGWDPHATRTGGAYTLPIRAKDGALLNLRRYQLDPGEDRRKIWGVTGHNDPVIYPVSQLDGATEVVLGEGEWDALLTIQNGFTCVTRTGAADVWLSAWNHLFDDKVVFLCHDMDLKGQKANAQVARELRDHAREIHIVELPYEVVENHGKDLTDYFHVDGYTAQDFKDLIGATEAAIRPPEVTEKELVEVGVLDSFGAEAAKRRLRMRVTITGKRNPTYLLPSDVDYNCNQAAGVKCTICPMNEAEGQMVRHIEGHNPIVLEMMGATAQQMNELLRKEIKAEKCGFLNIDVTEYRSVEELYVRPSVDRQSSRNGSDYTTRKIISVGRHDSLPNNTVEVVGTVYPSPRGQHNEFQAWDLARLQTSIDKFEVTPEVRRALRVFNGPPLRKLGEIARYHTAHTTKIVGRLEMHALVDLVFHSVIAFDFLGQPVERGWLDALIVGDTRTGKSETILRLMDLYRAGELVSCESASFAGIVGGLQQLGSGKEWEITWGAIPINDRRLVALDEISGLAHEQIAQMSSIRSSGEAQLTKIRSERTWARTRLIWSGNPRNGRMADYTYGVQAIAPLIGNNEDIARFDLAMSVRAEEVASEAINVEWSAKGAPSRSTFSPEQFHLGVLWAWSRRPEQVVWSEGAEHAVLEAARTLGQSYVESPPLVQAANARIKIARVAVALAARTFSTDSKGELVIVKPIHVKDAVTFIDRLYRMPGFGYYEISKEAIEDRREAYRMRDEAKAYLVSNRGLAKFLRTMTGHFRRQDMEDMLNLSREEANGLIGRLWQLRLITRTGPNIKVQPVLHELLREVKE